MQCHTPDSAAAMCSLQTTHAMGWQTGAGGSTAAVRSRGSSALSPCLRPWLGATVAQPRPSRRERDGCPGAARVRGSKRSPGPWKPMSERSPEASRSRTRTGSPHTRRRMQRRRSRATGAAPRPLAAWRRDGALARNGRVADGDGGGCAPVRACPGIQCERAGAGRRRCARACRPASGGARGAAAAGDVAASAEGPGGCRIP